MATTAQLKLQPHGSGKIRNIGRTVIRASLVVLFMTLVALLQIGRPPMGEIGHFAHDSSLVFIPMSLWGVVTGIGLKRAWCWSRFSMLIFGTLLTLVSALPGIAFLLTKQDGFPWWAVLLIRLLGLLFLIPPAIVVRWFWYFVGDEARNYFYTAIPTPSARS